MKNIKNIVFDFDGVLIRNSELLLKTHRETLGPFSEKNFKELFDGNTISGLSQYKFKNMDLFWKKWLEVLKNEKIDTEALNFLKNNQEKRKFIISSNKEDILNLIIRNSSENKLFSEVLGEGTHSSKIEKFLILEKEEKIKFYETIFITDSLGDLKEASHFPELKTIAVTFGVHDRERLKKGNPNFICDSWEEIEKLFL